MSAHRISRSLPYAQDQLFDLAADVERYPDFLPWWVAARVLKREGDVYYTDQVVRFGMVRKRFRSKTTLHRPARIDVASSDGIVRHLHLTWLFERRPGNGCQASLAVELELGSQVLQDLFARAMIQAVEPIMAAFERQAHRLYGGGASGPAATGKTTPGAPAN